MTEDNIRVEEEQNLNHCLSRIDEIIIEDKRWLSRTKPEGSGHPETDKAFRQMKDQEIENCKEARPRPYVGRVDFAADNSPNDVQAYYFGKFGIPHILSMTNPQRYVIDFTQDIFDLFVNPLRGEYKAPTGEITGNVKLKRGILIEASRLVDVIGYELPTEEKPEPEEDPLLTRELYKTKGEGLSDIIATIKPKQYEEVAAALQQVVVIQGVAGSGKSEVGLHRVVYLVAPHREPSLRILPERVAFFGPSKPFLVYISGLLPGFHVYKVRQTTIHDWLVACLSSRVKLERRDSLLEKQLSSTKKSLEDDITAARLKVSLNMARLLDRHVQAIRKGFVENAISIMKGQEVAVSKSRVKRAIRGSRHQLLNEQRRLALSNVERELQRGTLTRLEESSRADIEAQFGGFWPELDFREVYRSLLSDPTALLTASRGSITEREAKLLGSSLPKGGKSFRMEDLPALRYLDQLLNAQGDGRKRRSLIPLFGHVVVDEAQDVSPLEFLLLYRHSSNKSFTILGDMGQVVLPHRGITHWRDIRQVFTKESIRRWDMRVSYRSTYEMTKYANRILKAIAPGMPRAVPYSRHGEKPTFTRSKSYASMVTAIAEDIRSLQDQEIQTIAVLCKTLKQASKLQRRLFKEGIEDAVRLDRPSYERTKVAVGSVYATKGLEYDAVILADARRITYTGSALHNRLLYVAVTRAAHRLHIHWFGTLAEVLFDPTLLPKTKITKTGSKPKRNKKVNTS